MSFFRGTSVDQDARFFSQNKKLLAKLSFPKSFDQRVDLTKVKREVIGQWIAERVTQLLGFEDDIVVAMIINLLEPKVDEPPDPRQMQLTLTGFLEKDAPTFMEELWTLLLSAQAHPTGIPPAILEKKKQEMAQAAQDKRQLRDVLDRKRQDAAGTATAASDAPQRPRQDQKQYGLSHPGESRARGGREGGAAERGRERGGRRREERRRASPPRSRRPRSPSRSRSRSRSRSHSRSPSRSRSRRRSPPRSPSRSPSRSRRRRSRRSPSRSKSRDRTRGSRARRSPSRSRERGRRRDRRRSPSPRNRGKDRSPLSRSRSPSADQFGRQRRRTLSKSPSRSRQQKKRGRSRSASE